MHLFFCNTSCGVNCCLSSLGLFLYNEGMPNEFAENRKRCLRQQTELRRLLTDPTQFEAAMQLFFDQHARLHSAAVSEQKIWSYEDVLLGDLDETQVRQIPDKVDHSIAWILWHIARCEDITMNILIAGSPQVLNREEWLDHLHIQVADTGNTMDMDERAAFSNAVDIPVLRAYRLAVGKRTREIVQGLKVSDLKKKPSPAAIARVWDEGAVLEGADGIVEYWRKRTYAGLLLMPATRHNLTHLNEANQIKKIIWK